MDIEERIAKAKEALGPGVKIVPKRKKKKEKTRPVAAFTPKSKKRRRDMNRSEYSQCGKKIRYRTHADAVKAMQACLNAMLKMYILAMIPMEQDRRQPGRQLSFAGNTI